MKILWNLYGNQEFFSFHETVYFFHTPFGNLNRRCKSNLQFSIDLGKIDDCKNYEEKPFILSEENSLSDSIILSHEMKKILGYHINSKEFSKTIILKTISNIWNLRKV